MAGGQIQLAVERESAGLALTFGSVEELVAGACVVVNGEKIGDFGVFPAVVVDDKARVVERFGQVVERLQVGLLAAVGQVRHAPAFVDGSR